MSTNKNPIFLASVASSNIQLDAADTTVAKTIFTAGADGGAITNLSATTDDTTAITVVVSSNDGAQTNVLGEVIVLPGAGTDGSTPAKNILDAVAFPGVLQADGSLVVGANTVITVAAKVTITAAKVLSLSAVGGSYSV